jgi:hypothetical protein
MEREQDDNLRAQITAALTQLSHVQLLKVHRLVQGLQGNQADVIDEVDKRLLRAVVGNCHDDDWQGPLADYLADRISLGRLAELIGVPLLDLQARFHKLGLPLRWGAQTIEEAKMEDATAAALMR